METIVESEIVDRSKMHRKDIKAIYDRYYNLIKYYNKKRSQKLSSLTEEQLSKIDPEDKSYQLIPMYFYNDWLPLFLENKEPDMIKLCNEYNFGKTLVKKKSGMVLDLKTLKKYDIVNSDINRLEELIENDIKNEVDSKIIKDKLINTLRYVNRRLYTLNYYSTKVGEVRDKITRYYKEKSLNDFSNYIKKYLNDNYADQNWELPDQD